MLSKLVDNIYIRHFSLCLLLEPQKLALIICAFVFVRFKDFPSPYLLDTQGGKGSSEGKKVQQILTSKYVIGILDWFKILKNKKIHGAILDIAVNPHRPFCPKLVDYSACVPPALQNGFMNSFDFDNFESHKHPYTQFRSQTLLDLFPL